MFRNKVVLVTGGAHGIGKQIVADFKEAGAHVYMIDIQEGNHFVGDLSKKEVIEEFVQYVLSQEDHIDILINNAIPLFKGIDTCSYEEFQYALNVGLTAPFYLSKLCAPYFVYGSSIINMTSTRAYMSMSQSESYASAKGGISALTHALAVSLGPKVRVNSIAPGWIETDGVEYSGADAKQQPVGRVGNPKDISNMVLFLCSDKAGFITGENITIDGGMMHQMIYHDDHGWKLEE
ncbi:MAG: SDR family oxidoreductase [Firmicutes bacterium]|nr:SDR family oxidoreductase [Bacillota bacterium]